MRRLLLFGLGLMAGCAAVAPPPLIPWGSKDPAANFVLAEPDHDLDGVPNELDRCPDLPEDIDNYRDGDGCPDEDNDGDGTPPKG
jgi:hypothetical protein